MANTNLTRLIPLRQIRKRNNWYRIFISLTICFVRLFYLVKIKVYFRRNFFMKRLIIDMDHVMVNITQQFIDWYQEATGIYVSAESMLGKSETGSFPNPDLVWSFLFKPNFFGTAKVMEGSQKVVEELNKKYDLFIVSSAMEFPQSLPEKYEWLGKNFPFIKWQQICFCGSKKLIKGDIMIDDHLKNLEFFDGQKLLYTATHNALIEGYTRVNNWQEVSDLLL
jgi:5'-nucleotidase